METFPFAGIGGLAAIAVLVGAYALFAAVIRLTGAAASGVMSVVPGIATGIRDWTHDAEMTAARATASPPLPWEDLPPGTAIEDQVGAE